MSFDRTQVPEQLTTKVFLFLDMEDYGFERSFEDRLVVDHRDLSQSKNIAWIKLAELEVTFDIGVTSDELLNRQLQKLRDKKQQVLAEAQKKATEIETQIQSLQAIEYKPEERETFTI